MEITLIDNVSKSELAEIKKMIGEAFITNELFHEFGDINDRKELVMKYMDIYTDYVYESKALYGTENHKGIVGFIHSKKASVYPQLKMLIRLLKVIPCNGVQREHNKKLNNGLPILHKVPPKRDYGRYFCIMAEKGGTSHGGLTEKLSPFFHAKKQEVNAYGR